MEKSYWTEAWNENSQIGTRHISSHQLRTTDRPAGSGAINVGGN